MKAELSLEAGGVRSTADDECKHDSAIRGCESVCTPSGRSGEIDGGVVEFGLLRDHMVVVDRADRVESRQESIKPTLEGLHDSTV